MWVCLNVSVCKCVCERVQSDEGGKRREKGRMGVWGGGGGGGLQMLEFDVQSALVCSVLLQSLQAEPDPHHAA